MERKNLVRLNGEIVKIQHKKDWGITRGIIEVSRDSGTIDKVPFDMSYAPLLQLGKVIALGKVVTKNVRDKNGNSHKKIFVRISDWEYNYAIEHENQVELNGVLCKKDVLRTTPFGKTIMDIIIAMNDDSGKSYYPSAIVWGSVAEKMEKIPIGTPLNIQGRFQSREYLKDSELKTAYEISIKRIEEIPADVHV